jgi:prepilin-type N-terminal cleavage/methylation domain-containing protein
MAMRKGYTLSEVMVTVAIVGVLAAVATPLLINMTNFWRQTLARNAIQRDVRASMDTINRFARQGLAGTVTIDQVSGQPAFSRVSFNVMNSTGTVGQSVSFYQQNNKLYMRQGSNISLLSSNIAYIAFTYPRTDDVSIMSVAMTAQAPTYRGGTKALQLSIQKVRIMN